MDTSKTKLTKEYREINRAGVQSIAGPNQLNIDRKSQEPDAIPNTIHGKGTKKYAKWGKTDKYPRDVVDLNVQDTTSAACLNFKIKAHYGLGLFPHRKIVDSKGKETKEPIDLDQYPEIQDFLLRSDIENVLQGSAADFEWWNWTATELLPDANNKKIAYANRIPVTNSRLELQKDNGDIDNLYVSGDFGYVSHLSGPGEPIPILKKRDLYRDGGIEKYLKRKHVHVAKQPSVDRVYYPLPMWQSNNKFLNLSLEISDWILSNINNSINIKYHIEYPQEYFEYLVPKVDYETDALWVAAVKAEKETLFSEIDNYLAGVNNVGKYLHTYTMTDPRNPGEKIGFKITILENKTNHEAYLPAFDTSAAAIANAHNAPLDLVGLSLSKGMGGGSGSNIRESFNFYMQLHTQVPRQTTLEWLHIVKKINDWPKDIYFDYRNIVFQSVNENKSGYAIENEPTPTTDQK